MISMLRVKGNTGLEILRAEWRIDLEALSCEVISDFWSMRRKWVRCSWYKGMKTS